MVSGSSSGLDHREDSERKVHTSRFKIPLSQLGVVCLLLFAGVVIVMFPHSSLRRSREADEEARMLLPVPLRKRYRKKQTFAPINGMELYYEDTDPEGLEGLPTLVFIHGRAGNTLSWFQQVPFFREKFRCISYDCRGFHRSIDTQREGPDKLVDDLEGLLNYLAVTKVAIIAQSMGGLSALGFAHRHRDRVWALVLSNTWGMFDWPEIWEELPDLRESMPSPGPVRALGGAFQRDHPVESFMYTQIAGLNPPYPRLTKAPEGTPTLRQVRSLQIPVLMFSAEEDCVIPLSVVRKVARELPKAELKVIPDCGHSIHFEQPRLWNGMVLKFLTKNLNGSVVDEIQSNL